MARSVIPVTVVEDTITIGNLAIKSPTSLQALEAEIGPHSRVLHADVMGTLIFQWVWDDLGMFASGPSPDHVRGYYFRLLGGDCTALDRPQPHSQFSGRFLWHSIPLSPSKSVLLQAATNLQERYSSGQQRLEDLGLAEKGAQIGPIETYDFSLRERNLTSLFGSIERYFEALPIKHSIRFGAEPGLDESDIDYNVGAFFETIVDQRQSTTSAELVDDRRAAKAPDQESRERPHHPFWKGLFERYGSHAADASLSPKFWGCAILLLILIVLLLVISGGTGR